MIKPSWEELLQGELDGANETADSAKLKEVMASHPDLLARYREIQGVARSLHEVAEVEPPPGLVDDVLRAVRRRPLPPRADWLGTLRAAFARQPVLRYGFTFASGLAAGAVLVALASQPAPFGAQDRSHLTGTILFGGRLSNLETVDRQPIVVDGVKGEAVTRRRQDLVVTEVQIVSRQGLDVVFEFDCNVFTPLGFERSAASGTDVAVGTGQVRLRHMGEGRYVLVLGLEPGDSRAPVRLKIVGEGVSLERTLGTHP